MKYETEKQFFELATKKGLAPSRATEYAKFMVKAFPAKDFWTVESYATEWINRFIRGTHYTYSDAERTRVLKNLGIK